MTRQTFIQKHEERITRFWSKLVSHRDIDHAQSCISEKTWVHFFVYSYFHWLLFDFLLFWKTCIHMQMQSIKRFNINDSTLTFSFSWTLILLLTKLFTILFLETFFFWQVTTLIIICYLLIQQWYYKKTKNKNKLKRIRYNHIPYNTNCP